MMAANNEHPLTVEAIWKNAPSIDVNRKNTVRKHNYCVLLLPKNILQIVLLLGWKNRANVGLW